MKKIDHIRKSIYIIVGILTIISLVFTLCKKVGLCASSDFFPYTPNISDYPSELTHGYDFNDFMDFVSDDIGSYEYYSDYNDMLFYYVLDNGNPVFRVAKFYEPSLITTFSNGNSITYNNLNSYYGQYDIYFKDSSNPPYNIVTFYYTVSSEGFSRSSVNTSGSFKFNPSIHLFYSSSDFVYGRSDSYLGSPIFYKTDIPDPDVPSGHTKGGVMSNLEDSYILIEDFDGPGLDTSSPSDSSSIPAWLGKILNGLGSLNKTLQSGVLTLGDYIGSGIEKLLDKLNELKDLITGIYNWFTEDFDSNQFQSDLYSIPLISDLMGLTSLVENSGMFDWSDVTPAQTVSFTFDFGGAVLPHSTNTIDFSWYTGTVKTTCNAILCTFLVIGLFVTVVNQIPNIIGGHSGDKGGGSDS